MAKFLGIEIGVDRRARVARLWSNAELRRFAPRFDGSVVNVSAWRDEDKEGGRYRDYFTAAAEYRVTNWRGTRGAQGEPGEILLDLEAPLPADLEGQFHVVFNHTTLEHTFDVFRAFENLCRMTSDVLILVVPCVQEVHFSDSFKDYWRFTPFTLRRLCERHGLHILYESAPPEQPNAAVYLFLVASKHPERWSGRLPDDRIEDRFIGCDIIRNDPFTLFSTWCYRQLARFKFYRRLSRRFIKHRLKDD